MATNGVAMAAVALARLLWATAAEELSCVDENCGVNLVQIQIAKAVHRKTDYWYPGRAVDYNRSGYSDATGPWPLKAPSWKFEEAGMNFHQTPCIDHERNIYTGSDQGRILSFDAQGSKRWEVQGPSRACQNPFLYDSKLYTSCDDGSVMALDMTDGRILWHRQLEEELPDDTYSMTATEEFLFMPYGYQKNLMNPKDRTGSPAVALLRRSDGKLLWTFEVPGSSTVNLAPCMFETSVIFNDVSGGIYHLRLSDGSVIWKKEALSPGSYTLGGVSCSADGKVYNGFSVGTGKNETGGLQALNISTGERIFTKQFSAAVHNAPAVGKVYGHNRLAVVFGMGEPAGVPIGPPRHVNGTVFAADAETGEVLWSFEPAAWDGVGVAGSTMDQICLPDLFSAATISKDGTVYINWSAGGVTYALRDVNKDGLCDLHDPEEVSFVDLGSGATGPPAIADHMLFVNTCRRPSAFLD
ncbi:unnamed protein product [Durusdinium trenchii]|uniref:Pyrrolo-quinoline quinone repeat domain-containing protein n=1 Tax=Durusdinium trenchii TaxID=1381693 RepID=A0ABP0J301_9DINO